MGADLRQDEGTFLVLPFVLAGSSRRFRRRCVRSLAHRLIELYGRPPIRPTEVPGRVRFQLKYVQDGA